MQLRFFTMLLLLGATAADAQLARVRSQAEPVGFISLGAGFLRPDQMRDASTNADWLFDATVQYRGSLEYAIRNQSAFGVAGTYARVPLRYRDRGGILGGGCTPCDADATIWTAVAFFRAGGGEGFHQIIEFSVGATGYQDFESDAGPLPPADVDIDFSLGIGYGFGYGFGKRMSIFLVQSADQSLHQSGGSSSEGSSFVQQYVTRIGARYGFGTRRTF